MKESLLDKTGCLLLGLGLFHFVGKIVAIKGIVIGHASVKQLLVHVDLIAHSIQFLGLKVILELLPTKMFFALLSFQQGYEEEHAF
mgnify:CR=1 FL=1